MAAPVTLGSMLQRVVDEQFGGLYKSFAEAIEMDPAHAARLARGQVSVSVETCLRIAEVCDLDPDAVLRAAGKGDTADRIRKMYGRAAPVRAPRTEAQRDWARRIEMLEPADRERLADLLKRFTTRR